MVIGIVISPMVNFGLSFVLTTFLVPLLLVAYVGNYLYFEFVFGIFASFREHQHCSCFCVNIPMCISYMSYMPP